MACFASSMTIGCTRRAARVVPPTGQGQKAVDRAARRENEPPPVPSPSAEPRSSGTRPAIDQGPRPMTSRSEPFQAAPLVGSSSLAESTRTRVTPTSGVAAPPVPARPVPGGAATGSESDEPQPRAARSLRLWPLVIALMLIGASWLILNAVRLRRSPARSAPVGRSTIRPTVSQPVLRKTPSDVPARRGATPPSGNGEKIDSVNELLSRFLSKERPSRPTKDN